MDIKTLQKDMIAAMKARDKARKESISALIQAVKKTAIDAGCRDEIPEEMVNKVCEDSHVLDDELLIKSLQQLVYFFEDVKEKY